MKLSYAQIVDEIQPKLTEVSEMGFSLETPIEHHIAIAENLDELQKKASTFWALRTKFLEGFVEKDADGKPIKEFIVDENGRRAMSFKLSPENTALWNEKLKELKETLVEIKLVHLEKKWFEGIDNLKPSIIRGIYPLLK